MMNNCFHNAIILGEKIMSTTESEPHYNLLNSNQSQLTSKARHHNLREEGRKLAGLLSN